MTHDKFVDAPRGLASLQSPKHYGGPPIMAEALPICFHGLPKRHYIYYFESEYDKGPFQKLQSGNFVCTLHTSQAVSHPDFS